MSTVPYWLAALIILFFLGALGTIILMSFVDITHIINYNYFTVWTPTLGEAMLQVECYSSHSQNYLSELNCFVF